MDPLQVSPGGVKFDFFQVQTISGRSKVRWSEGTGEREEEKKNPTKDLKIKTYNWLWMQSLDLEI